jgi:hypothetical protein
LDPKSATNTPPRGHRSAPESHPPRIPCEGCVLIYP